MPDIPCPHCGQLNETQREVCWACCKLLKPQEMKPKEAPPAKFDIPGSIPMPPLSMPELLSFGSIGSANVFRTMETKIAVNGKEYANLEDVPEPFRSSLKNSLNSAQEAMRSGKKRRIVVNGREYANIEDVPEPFRSQLKEGLAKAKPDIVKVAQRISETTPFLSGMSLFIRILLFSLIPYAVIWLRQGYRTVGKGTDTMFFCMAVNLFGVVLIWASCSSIKNGFVALSKFRESNFHLA